MKILLYVFPKATTYPFAGELIPISSQTIINFTFYVDSIKVVDNSVKYVIKVESWVSATAVIVFKLLFTLKERLKMKMNALALLLVLIVPIMCNGLNLILMVLACIQFIDPKCIINNSLTLMKERYATFIETALNDGSIRRVSSVLSGSDVIMTVPFFWVTTGIILQITF